MTKAAVKQKQPKDEELPPQDILTSINEPFSPVRNALRPASINEPPTLPNPPDPPDPPDPGQPPPNPSLNSINPNSAKEDAGSVSFNATGTRFYEGSKINFGGDFIDTLFVDTGKLTGTFDTTAYGEGSYLVHVDSQEGGLSINKTFTITAAGTAADDVTVEAVDPADPDEMEDEIEAAEEEGDFKPTHASPRKLKRKK